MSLPDPLTTKFSELDPLSEAELPDGEFVAVVYGRSTPFGGGDKPKYLVFLVVGEDLYHVMIDADERPNPWDVLQCVKADGQARVVETLS